MIIDTTTLQFKGLIFNKKNLSRFQFLPSNGTSPDRYVFNPNNENSDYLPNITIRKIPKLDGGYFTESDFQFSVPKIMHGTNYFGIDEKDSIKTMESLENKLEYVFNGKIVTKAHIHYAEMKNIAFAFNFTLSQYPDLLEFLKLIPFASMGKRYKKVKHTYYTEERELGFCGRIYNKQVGWKMYAKGAEVINNAETIQEKETAKRIENKELPYNILRMEITFQNRTSLKKHLAALTDRNAEKERYFYEVFNNQLAQKILLDAFNELANELDITALDLPIYNIDECFYICEKAGWSEYDAYALMGRSLKVRQAGSLQLKLTSDKYYDRRMRSTTDKRLEKILAKNPLPAFEFKKIIEECRKQLTEFKVMKPEDFVKNDLVNFNKVV